MCMGNPGENKLISERIRQRISIERQDRYDEQLKDILGIDPTTKSTEEKIKILRDYREEQYTMLQDAVYKKRGWTSGGCPTTELVKELGIDYDDVVDIIKLHQ